MIIGRIFCNWFFDFDIRLETKKRSLMRNYELAQIMPCLSISASNSQFFLSTVEIYTLQIYVPFYSCARFMRNAPPIWMHNLDSTLWSIKKEWCYMMGSADKKHVRGMKFDACWIFIVYQYTISSCAMYIMPCNWIIWYR